MTVMAWLWIGLSVLGALVLAVRRLARRAARLHRRRAAVRRRARPALIIIVAILLAVGGAIAWRIISRRRAAAKIAQAMTETVAEDSDAPVLKQKMEDALAVLKRTGKSSARALYDLPWYLIIGPPGAGKTTALVNSGLKFPLAGGQRGHGRAGRRRHAILRLVVHRRGGADRHRRPLYDAGFGRQGRSPQLARLPRHAGPESSAPADQRRHRRDQHRRCSQPVGRRR